MITGKCKGARDILPGEMAKFNFVTAKFRKACLARGFEEIRTPVIEYFHLFTSAGTLTPRMLGRVYSFLDWDGWSGERVVLRPEGTIPTARLYLENYADGSLSRLFYVENMFSFEENVTQPREKWQGGVELIGSSEVSADMELITLAMEILENFNIGPVEIKLSHAGHLKAMLSSLGLPPEKEEKLFEAILDGQDMKEAIASISFDMAKTNRFNDLILLREKTLRSLENLKSITKLSPDMKQKIENFAEISSNIAALGYKFKMDFAGARGLEYYTGIYYRLYIKDIEVGGGGRYDSLVKKGNGSSAIPASGFALYLDKIISLLPDMQLGQSSNTVYIITDNRDKLSLLEIMKAAKALRDKGFKTELALKSRQAEKKRWVLKYLNRTSGYNLKDVQLAKAWKLKSMTEVLKKMEELCQ